MKNFFLLIKVLKKKSFFEILVFFIYFLIYAILFVILLDSIIFEVANWNGEPSIGSLDNISELVSNFEDKKGNSELGLMNEAIHELNPQENPVLDPTNPESESEISETGYSWDDFEINFWIGFVWFFYIFFKKDIKKLSIVI